MIYAIYVFAMIICLGILIDTCLISHVPAKKRGFVFLIYGLGMTVFAIIKNSCDLLGVQNKELVLFFSCLSGAIGAVLSVVFLVVWSKENKKN